MTDEENLEDIALEIIEEVGFYNEDDLDLDMLVDRIVEILKERL